MRGRIILALAITAGVTAFVGVQFFRAADATLSATRGNACRSLEPAALPDRFKDGQPPPFDLPDANGRRWTLEQLRGRPVLLNFWATWCPPCVEEMPALESLARKLGDRAVVLAVSTDDDWAKVKHFFRKGTALSVVLDASAEVPKKFGTEKYPETFLIGADGKIAHYIVNKRKWDAPQAVECLLGLQ
ncbi:MAG: TlpA disulfide reductase family protein [Deltaproteobacteria bacterium]|nr:TlpA disulfide reductase family protein [Deltaproteobacteria bacterium]